MDNNQFDELIVSLQMIARFLGQISANLDQINQRLGPEAPNFQRPLAAYRAFDWAGIGAIPDEEDQYGVTVVSFGGYQWKRRYGEGKFGKAIWFSRSAGKNEEGEADYLRLITFKDLEPVQPLPGSLVDFAEEFHLHYGNGQAVPKNQEAIDNFNAFMAEKRRPPADRDELVRWYKEKM